MTKSTYFIGAEYKTCSFEGCGRQAQKRSGLCSPHREQQKRGRDLKPLPITWAEVKDQNNGECLLKECVEVAWSKGYCNYHYQQLSNGKEFTPRPEGVAKSKECSFQGCDRLQHSKGLCSSHAKQRRSGKELKPLRERSTTWVCSFEGCNLEKRTRGLCSAHYTQSRTKGDLKTLRKNFVIVGVCKVGWCEEGSDIRGLCRNHLTQATRFRLSTDEVVELFTLNECAICGEEPEGKSLHIDHDHSCCPGRGSCGSCVRGILCSPCNLAIGKMKDSPDRLEAAAKYIREGKYEFN